MNIGRLRFIIRKGSFPEIQRGAGLEAFREGKIGRGSNVSWQARTGEESAHGMMM